MNDVEGIVCEHYPHPPPNTEKTFVIDPKNYTATMSLPLLGESKSTNLKVGKVKVRQFGVNSNYATTCHKMQASLFFYHTFAQLDTNTTSLFGSNRACLPKSSWSGHGLIHSRTGCMLCLAG